MTNNKSENHDPMVALLGTPVDPNRKMQGKSQSAYLSEGPGDQTRIVMALSGVSKVRTRRLRMRWVLVLVLAVGTIAAAVVALK